MQNRGVADHSWITSHHSKRPILATDRLPDLNLSHSGAPLNADAARGPTTEHVYSDPYSNSKQDFYSHNPPDIGLKTPSPSPTSQSIAHSAGSLSETDPTQSRQLHYNNAGETYTIAMNQQPSQYMDAQHSMSAGQQYGSHPTTANSMAHYPSYHHQQQPPVLQPGPGHYAQSPASYAPTYAYSSGMSSPHGSGQPVSSSIPSHMNPGGLPPLPSECTLFWFTWFPLT